MKFFLEIRLFYGFCPYKWEEDSRAQVTCLTQEDVRFGNQSIIPGEIMSEGPCFDSPLSSCVANPFEPYKCPLAPTHHSPPQLPPNRMCTHLRHLHCSHHPPSCASSPHGHSRVQAPLHVNSWSVFKRKLYSHH